MVSLVRVVVDHGGLGLSFVGGCRPSKGWDSSSIRGGGRRPLGVGGGVAAVRACSSSVGGCRSLVGVVVVRGRSTFVNGGVVNVRGRSHWRRAVSSS
jgi:hypothetical protein